MGRLLVSILVLTALGTSAWADPVDHIRGCFIRVYDRAHLAQHVDQVVTAVKLLVKDSKPGDHYKYEFSLQLKLRGRNEVLHTGVDCQKEEPGLQCNVECDGGGMYVSFRSDRSVMMFLDRIRMAACGQDYVDGGEEVLGGKDDREFRLDRANDVVCASE